MNIDAYGIAHNLLGVHEVPGAGTNPLIAWMLSTCGGDPVDEIPWCSAFVNGIAALCGVQRSKSLAARSWLTVGTDVPMLKAFPAWDIVILSRPPESWSGHVGFYHWHDAQDVWLLGGNQSDAVTIAPFSLSRVLGVRRLAI